jgi:hypothetical protein
MAKWQEPKGETKPATVDAPPPVTVVAPVVAAPAKTECLYQVTGAGTVCHSGRVYAAGEPIELTKAEAERLIALGAVSEI